MMIQYAVLTKTGNRTVNEDAAGVFDHEGLYGFVVCDGLGGHGMGDVAASLAVERFGEFVATQNSLDKTALESFFALAQRSITDKQAELKAAAHMKTTCTVLLLDGHDACIANLGDSRAYMFCGDTIVYRTCDDSVPGALARAGYIPDSMIRTHPDRSRLLKALGVQTDKAVRPTLSEKLPYTDTSAFLLCTDGFWEYITEEKMIMYLHMATSPREWLNYMEREVLKNGHEHRMDNYTAITIGDWF